ncbi:MAG: hypothetical protein ACLRNW_25645, partial [Neglectibacter sp.]
LFAPAAGKHRQSKDTGGGQRRNTFLHHFTLLFCFAFSCGGALNGALVVNRIAFSPIVSQQIFLFLA